MWARKCTQPVFPPFPYSSISSAGVRECRLYLKAFSGALFIYDSTRALLTQVGQIRRFLWRKRQLASPPLGKRFVIGIYAGARAQKEKKHPVGLVGGQVNRIRTILLLSGRNVSIKS